MSAACALLAACIIAALAIVTGRTRRRLRETEAALRVETRRRITAERDAAMLRARAQRRCSATGRYLAGRAA